MNQLPVVTLVIETAFSNRKKLAAEVYTCRHPTKLMELQSGEQQEYQMYIADTQLSGNRRHLAGNSQSASNQSFACWFR